MNWLLRIFKKAVNGKLYVGVLFFLLDNCFGVPSVSDFLQIRLKKLRVSRGFTQEECAEKCGIPYKVFQHLERGRRDNPRLSTLEKLAKGLGVSVHELFSPEMPKVKPAKRPSITSHYKRRKTRRSL